MEIHLSIYGFVGIPVSAWENPPIHDIAFELDKLKLEPTELIATCKLIDWEKGKLLDTMLKSFDEREFCMVGNYLVHESIREDGIIRKIELQSMSVIPTKDRA